MESSARQIDVLYVDDESDFGELRAAFFERQDERFNVTVKTSVTEVLEFLEGAAINPLRRPLSQPVRHRWYPQSD